MEKTYMIGKNYILYVEQKNDGFLYQCFDVKNKNEAGGGVVNQDDIDQVTYPQQSMIRDPILFAGVLAMNKVGLEGAKIATVSNTMLAQFLAGRKFLQRIEKFSEDLDEDSIRFIDSRYNELFRIPNGGMIQINYPADETFPVVKRSMKCKYLNEYHTQIEHRVFHICEFAELAERNGWTYYPEPIVTNGEAEWKFDKGFIKISVCDNGNEFIIYDENHEIVDQGMWTMKGSLNEVRNAILSEYNITGSLMLL